MSLERKELLLFMGGSFIAKAFSFLLFFIIVRFLSPSEMGKIELYNTNISLLFPILSLQISEANIRFLSNDYEKNKLYLSNIIFIVLIQVVIIFFAFLIFRRNLVLLTIIFMIFNSFLSLYARAINKSEFFRLSEIIQKLFMIVFIWYILLYKDRGYILVTITSYLISDCIIGFNLRSTFKIDSTQIDFSIIKELIKYTFPLILNGMGWWMITSADRYVIKFFYDDAYVGIYAVVTKMSSIVMLIMQNVYYVYQKKYINCFDRNETIPKRINSEYLGIIFIITFISLIIPKQILQIMLGQQYSSYLGMYYLFVPTVMYWALSVFYGIGYLLNKNTYGISSTTAISALINVILNFVLTNQIGMTGTIVATNFALLVWFLMRYINAKEAINCKLSFKHILLIAFLQIMAIARFLLY